MPEEKKVPSVESAWHWLDRAVDHMGRGKHAEAFHAGQMAREYLTGAVQLPPMAVDAVKRLKSLAEEGRKDILPYPASASDKRDWQFRRDNREARKIATEKHLIDVLTNH